MEKFLARDLGSITYEEAWKLQLSLLEERADNKIPNTLLLLDHPHVITLGRKSPEVRAMSEEKIPKSISGIPVHIVERGGEATYHGPGQLVAYPIFAIPEKMGPKGFLRVLENSTIDVLRIYDIGAYFIEEKTGVWLKDAKGQERKIASLGIALRKNISYHGLALNVSTELENFSLISPCGFAPQVMTSLEEIIGKKISLREVKEKLQQAIFQRCEEAGL